MNENYVDKYIDFNGKLTHRSISRKILIIIFAGIKFLFDRVMAITGLVISLPLMIVIGIAIKLDSKGPVIFKQLRTGKNGKLFYIYKFRTMVQNNDVHDFSNSDKYTKIGKILRKTSLDEIPQLISIAIGKMSFIGPRPWIPDYYENMNEIQKQRYNVRPGLTGLAQCMGRNNLTIFKKIEYDIMYIKNYSFIQDIKIIVLTIKSVFTCNGYEAGKETIKTELTDLKQYNRQKISFEEIR